MVLLVVVVSVVTVVVTVGVDIVLVEVVGTVLTGVVVEIPGIGLSPQSTSYS